MPDAECIDLVALPPLRDVDDVSDYAVIDISSSDDDEILDSTLEVNGITFDSSESEDLTVSDDESAEQIDDDEDDEDDEDDDDDDDDRIGRKRMLWTAEGENAAELSDSEEDIDTIGPLRRVGNVPKHWYDHLEHIGYNVDGKSISKKTAIDAIDRFLSSQDTTGRRTIYDYDNDRQVTISTEDVKMLRRIREGTYAHASFDEASSHFQIAEQREIHPLGNPCNPTKSRFVPSKHEHRIINKYVQALRNGWIRPRSEVAEERRAAQCAAQTFLLWNEDGSSAVQSGHTKNLPPVISAPKAKLPGHAESYNPPEEYLPSADEAKTWHDEDSSLRSQDFLPTKYSCLRHVPHYASFVQDRFERCLDLYMCPRLTRRKPVVDPDSLVPSLPKPSTLRPFPRVLSMVFRGHTDKILSLSTSPCGQYLASGARDGTARVWEMSTSRCLRSISLGHPVHTVAFNPSRKHRGIIALVTERELRLVSVGLDIVGDEKCDAARKILNGAVDASARHKTDVAQWSAPEQRTLRVVIDHHIKRFCWHGAGDYFATVSDMAQSKSVLLHRLSERTSQAPFSRSKGEVQDIAFHPSRPFFFVATKRHIRVYNLQKQKMLKKLQTPAQWINRMAVHPSGDHLIVGTTDCRVCWYDLDLSTRPFKTLRYHTQSVCAVTFHATHPLFASGSTDGTLHLFHGRVSQDLMKDALIVPVRIIDGYGSITDVIFHPHQPWVIASYNDGLIRMFVP